MNKTKKLTLLALVVAMFMAFSSAIAMMMPSNKTYATDTAVVTTEAELVAAIANGGDIKLTDDITTTAAIVTNGVTAIIDLNGNTLTIGAGDNKFNDASNITIKNGNIIITGVTVNGNAIFCLDEYEKTLKTVMTLEDVDLTGNGYSSAYGIFYIGASSELNVIGGVWDLANDTHTSGGVFKADASGAVLNVRGTEMTLHNVRRVVTYAATVIEDSTITVTGDADGVDAEMEHGFNRSPLTIKNSTVTMTDMVGRGITAENGAVSIENSTVSIKNVQEATIDVRNNQTVTVDTKSTVTLDKEATITSGTISGTVTVGIVKIGDVAYDTFDAAITAAKAMTGDVVIELYGKVEYTDSTVSLTGAYDSIKFVGKTSDAEISITRNGSNGYISGDGNDCAVAFEDLILSKPAGSFADDAGFMNVAFTVYRVGSVSYTNCTFPNGACAAGCPTSYTKCTFQKSHDKYAVWAYGSNDITIDTCVFNDDRGIKMYAEGAAKTTAITVTNSDFSELTGKPAIVLTYGESVTLEGNTYSSTGVLELEDNGSSNGTTITSTDTITCVSDAYPNGCGVLVDGVIYRTVADAAAVATAGDTVTLLHNSTETVELAEGVTLEKNGYTADGVTVKVSAPTSTLTNCYTSGTGYWGECGGNASVSFVFKFYNGDTYMGYTSLNNVGGIIDGDVYVSWSIKLDAASNTDEYWTMEWDGHQPTIDMQPTRVEHWVDGVKCAEAAVEPNWSDGIFPVVAAVTDAEGKILSYVNGTAGYTIQDAFTNGGNIVLLRDITLTETLNIPADVTVTLDLNGKTISQTKAQTAGYQMILNDGELTINDRVGSGKISYTDSGNGGEYISDVIYNRATLVINGGTIENLSSATVATNGYPHAVDTYSGIRDTSVTINGGTIYCAEYSAIRMFCVSATYKADLVINGGTIKGAIDMQNGTKNSALGTLTINGGTFETTKNANNIRFANWNGGATEYGISASIEGGSFNGGITTQYVPAAANWDNKIISGGTFAKDLSDFCAEGFVFEENEDGTYGVVEVNYVAQIGEEKFVSLADAIAAVKAGETITLLNDATLSAETTIPANVTINGNGKTINGSIVAEGNITFVGHTKVTSFNAGYNKPTVTIGEGACLEVLGPGRMVIGHGATFNITGSIVDAKTADTADLTPSLIMPGASFTGAGVTFNVTNAYIKTTASYCSSSSSASGTFDINIINSIWEQFGKLAFEAQSTAATVNFELKDSVLTTTSHLVFGVSRGEVIIDNSNVNVGTSRQIENQSTMTVKNGSVVNGTVATSSNAKNPGTLIVDNATYAVTGEFSGSDLGTGTLIVKNGASFTAGSITKANIQIDAAGMTAGDEVNVTANLTNLAGTLEVINNDGLDASIVDGKIVLSKVAAKIGDDKYTDLHEAMTAAKAGETVLLLGDVDLAGTTWEPVSFAGTFDGQNFTIYNLTINKPGVSNTGFITSLNGTFKNVTFTNPTVTGGENTGIVAGRAGGSAALAENIIINGTIKVETTHTGYARLGAIVGGWAYGNYKNITVDGGDKAVSYLKHTGGGDGRYVAGIVGHADDVESYINCTVKNITISGGWLCGGICGPGPSDGIVSGCAVENLDMGADYSGGMFGWYYGSGTVENSSVKDVTFTDGSTNNGAIGGYSNNTDATVSNVTIENVANKDGAPLLNHVAQIGKVNYDSLQAAIDAAQNGATVTLLKDLTITSDLNDAGKGYFNIADGKNVTLDLNGKKITVTDNSTGNFILFYSYGEFTIKNGTIELTATNNRYWDAESAIILNRGGVLNVVSGTYKHLGGTDMAFVVDNSGNYYGNAYTYIGVAPVSAQNAVSLFSTSATDTAPVLDSTYIAIRNRMEQNSHGASGTAYLTVYDGTISGISRAVWAQAASTSETAPATGEINVYGGEIGLIDTARSTGAVSMTTISGGTVSAVKAEVGELTVTGGEVGEVTLLNAAGEAVVGVQNADGVYVQAVAAIGETYYATIQAAVDAAEAGDTVTIIAEVSDEAVAVDKNLTITGSVTLNNVSINAVEGCTELTVSGLNFTGNSWINSGAADKLTVSGVTANVTPSNTAYTNSRSAFISLGRSEQKELELVVENSNIVANGGTDPILGWASITEATITGNTFGAEDAYQESSDSIKFMAIAEGAEFTITGNTVYSNYNGFVFGQNTTRDNAYSVVLENNTFIGSADHVWVEVSGATTTHATINASSNNTVNGEAFTASDIKVHPNITTWTSYAGVDVVTDENGKVIGGTLAYYDDEVLAEGIAAIKDLNGNYVVGEKPTATVNNLGMTTVAAGNYMVYGGGTNAVDMPLSFVMQFLADQGAEDMASSPYAEWYGDFVLTFTGIENGSFIANGCYLAGHYGEYGWVKVPVDGMTIEEGVRYPVMLGVGLGQKYDYICSSVEDFKCALYLTPEILAANPNLKVTLELSVVDSSQGSDAATSALINNENVYSVAAHNYEAEDFIVSYVAEVNGTKYATITKAIAAANAGDIVEILTDITLTESITVESGKVVTLDINGKVVSMADASNAGCYMIKNYGSLTIIDSVGNGKLTFNSTTPDSNYFSYSTSTIGNAGDLTIKSGIIENTTVGGASYAIDNIWYSKDVSLTINGGTITADKIAVRQVPFSTTYKNVVTITGGTLTGATAGLQTFNTSAAANLAEVNITCGTFNGTYAFYTSYKSANGSAGTTINIDGGEFNGYVYLYNSNAGGAAMDITVTDGTFNGGYYAFTYDVNSNIVGIPSVKGGTFAYDVTDYCANGFVCVKNEDDTYGVHEAAAIVAVVYDGNGEKIATIEKADFAEVLASVDEYALNNTIGSVIITLNGDVTTTETINVKYATYIHGEGHKLTYTGVGVGKYAINTSAKLMIDHLTIDAKNAERGINYNNTSAELELDSVNVTASTYAINFQANSDNAQVTIKNSTLTANIALNIWGEDMVITVNDSVLTSVDNIEKENYSAIQLNSNGSIAAEGTIVNVTGGSITALDYNGSLSSAVSNWTSTGKVNVSKDTTVTGNIIEIVAIVNGYGEVNLQDAFDCAERLGTAATITLIRDITVEQVTTLANGANVTLDLNGHVITGIDNTTKGFSVIENYGTLTIKDSVGGGKITLKSTIDSGWDRYSAVISNNPGGKITVESGLIEHLGGTDMAYGIDNRTNGKGTYAETIINGGTIKSAYIAIRQFLNGVEADNILTVNGGTINGANSSIYFQDPSAKANTGKLVVESTAILTNRVYLEVAAGSTEWPVEISIADAAFKNGTVLTNGNIPAGYEVAKANGTWGVTYTAFKFVKYTITVSGEIGYNVYIRPSAKLFADSNAYVEFTTVDADVNKVVRAKYLLSEGIYSEDDDAYRFTVGMMSYEMTTDITTTVYDGEGVAFEKTFTSNIQTYANYLLTNSTDAELIALLKAMVNYGAQSQLYFGIATDKLANSILDEENGDREINETLGTTYTNWKSAVVEDEANDGIDVINATIMLESTNAIRIYLNIDESIDVSTLTVTGATENKVHVHSVNGRYYVEVDNIYAYDIDTYYTVTVTDGTATVSVTYSVLNYIKSTINKNGAATDVVMALNIYNQAANAYFNK